MKTIQLTDVEWRACISALGYASSLLAGRVCDDLNLTLSDVEKQDLEARMVESGTLDEPGCGLVNWIVLAHLKRIMSQ